MLGCLSCDLGSLLNEQRVKCHDHRASMLLGHYRESALDLMRRLRFTARTLMPTLSAAACTLFPIVTWAALAGFNSTATRESFGTILSSSSRCLELRSPGEVRESGDVAARCARLLTKPAPTGSVETTITIGVVVVAFCAAMARAGLEP